MNPWVSLALLLLIIFTVQYLSELWTGRLNRRTAGRIAEALETQVEVNRHVLHVIEDLRGIQPEKDEILEIVALQLRSSEITLRGHQHVMQRLSTKVPFWAHLVPLSVIAGRNLREVRGQKHRNRTLRTWIDEHPDGDVDPA